MLSAAIAQSIKRRICDRKVADSRFDSRTGNASLCPWERHLTLIFHWTRVIHPLWGPRLTKDLQTELKKVLFVGVVRQTQSGLFVFMNDFARGLYSFEPQIRYFVTNSCKVDIYKYEVCSTMSATSLTLFVKRVLSAFFRRQKTNLQQCNR